MITTSTNVPLPHTQSAKTVKFAQQSRSQQSFEQQTLQPEVQAWANQWLAGNLPNYVNRFPQQDPPTVTDFYAAQVVLSAQMANVSNKLDKLLSQNS